MVELEELLAELYPRDRKATAELAARFTTRLAAIRDGRSAELRAWDRSRPADWHTGPSHVAYVAYADLFTQEMEGGPGLVRAVERLDYLADLGVTNLHLLPIFATSGDGGFAIDDYRKVRADLGTMDDLEELARQAHRRGLALTVDFVLNHTSDRHPWALAAKAGDPAKLAYFVPDETGTGRHWPGVPDVFPDFAPGHWDWVPELGKYLWSTFYARQPDKDGPVRNSFSQWDLNYRNPDVLLDMLETMGYLLNRGIDCLRLDAIPFLWKTPGTSCTSQPELHLVLRIIRMMVEAIAPRAVILAEANDQLAGLTEYFGTGPRWGGEAQLAYGFPVMPFVWLAAATGDAEPLMTAITRLPQLPPGCAWLVFDEVHDEVTLDAVEGMFPGPKGLRLARGLFEHFTREGRGIPFRFDPKREAFGHGISSNRWTMLDGETAELAGDAAGVERAIERTALMEAVKQSLGGPALLYSGAELGLASDHRFHEDPVKAPDTRFAKRRPLPRAGLDRLRDPKSKEARIHGLTRELVRIRKSQPAFGPGRAEILATPAASVLGYRRRGPDGADVWCWFQFGDTEATVTVPVTVRDLRSGETFEGGSAIKLGPRSFRWLRSAAGGRCDP